MKYLLTNCLKNFVFIINYFFDVFQSQFLAIFRNITSLSMCTAYMVNYGCGIINNKWRYYATSWQ